MLAGTFIIVAILLPSLPVLAQPQTKEGTERVVAFFKEIYSHEFISNSPPTTDSVLTFLGRWPWGPCLAVAAEPGYAFIGNGTLFQSLDVSTPSTPTIIGEYDTQIGVNDIWVRDSLAFVGTTGVLILNIADPAHPTRVAEVPMSSGVVRVAVEANLVYVLTYTAQLKIFDISDPAAPQPRGWIGGVGGDRPRSFAVHNGYAYIGDFETFRLSIVNATNPDSLWGTNLSSGMIFSLEAMDTLLYSGGWGPFKVFSIADPMNPVLLGSVNVGQLMNAMEVVSSNVYATTDTAGMYSIDVSNPRQPVVNRHLRPTSPAIRTGLAIASSDSSIFAAQHVGMWIVNKDSLTERAYFRTGESATRVSIKSHIAFVADGRAGLWIVDISDPTQPRGIGNVNTGSYTCDVIATDSVAYFVNYALSSDDQARGVWTVDVSEPAAPRVLSHYVGIARVPSTGITHFNSISMVGNLLFLTQMGNAVQDSTLEIIDVSNPHQLSRVSVLRSAYGPYYVATEESLACLANPIGGLRIVDWSIPSSPVEVGVFDSSIVGVMVANSLAYADRIDTVFILSLANPSIPSVVGRYGRVLPLGFVSTDLTVDGSFLYWAGAGLLGVVDISDPTKPRQLTVIGGPEFVAACTSIVATGVGASGLWLYRNERIADVDQDGNNVLSQSIRLFPNYPNPFNPVTTIRFSLPYRSLVVLQVHDLLGREVETLLNRVIDRGEYSAVWNASSRSSGVYYLRLKVGNNSVTRPMQLIK